MVRTETPWGPWEPESPARVARRFAGTPTPWWIAGGYAIELAAGRALREHADVDVLLPRRDQLAAQRALPGWEWWAADPPGTLRRWAPGEVLPAGVHDIWCRPGPAEPWRIQVMLDETAGRWWVSRRDARVRLPLARIGRRSPDGVPYLAPEVQLYYKAAAPRAKDERDFTAVLPCLAPPQRAWLSWAVGLTRPDHPWRARLAG
ncbi:nucleotidyltransferase domain-containing protein [Streptomyces sp. NPDC057702]|uniref:nucleotidyltransferase domain-containing protein n=1 Tax=unclassified Streptomyces TaxID=2593676 RepID=UPI0036884ABC